MLKCKRFLASCLIATTALSFVACKSNEESKVSNTGEMPDEVSVFCLRSPTLIEDMKDYNDVASFQAIEKMTGVKPKWTLTPSSAFEEKFNLMVASGKYPDAIVAPWKGFGAEKYFSEGVIINLKDYEEYMPNFMKYTKDNPDKAKDYVTHDGKILYLPYIRDDKELNVFFGPLMREDWLQKLGLEIPKNADELYNVLKAFKTQDPNGNGEADEIPMSGIGSESLMNLMAMFNSTHDFYIKDGKVVYGMLEDEFKEGLEYICKLYKEKLIDPDYIFQERAKQDGKITSNKVGFVYSYQPTVISNQMKEKDPDFKFVGIPNLENKEGIRKTYNSAYTMSVLPGTSIAISTQCKNPSGVLKWLDTFYSPEGIEAMNFGIEGDTYTKENGECKFTDKVLNNPDADPAKMFKKTSGVYNSYFPSVQKWASYKEALSPYGRQAIETWSDNVNTEGILPGITFTEEEKEEVSNKMAQIGTYADEMLDKIIVGQKSISELDNIKDELRKLGIEDVISIYQKAYDRY